MGYEQKYKINYVHYQWLTEQQNITFEEAKRRMGIPLAILGKSLPDKAIIDYYQHLENVYTFVSCASLLIGENEFTRSELKDTLYKSMESKKIYPPGTFSEYFDTVFKYCDETGIMGKIK